jgi:HPt (histidine-containing phosphotransfer) domain-containing protein
MNNPSSSGPASGGVPSSMLSGKAPIGPRILSSMTSDPDMVELIEMFVAEMPGRADAIRTAFHCSQWKALADEAHRLRGSAGGHGFNAVGVTAGTLEDLVRAQSGNEQAALDKIRAQTEELISMCLRCSMK